MWGCSGGTINRLAGDALLEFRAREPCMRGGHDPRSLTMAFSYSRRDIVVAACSASLVILAQPGIAAPMSFKVDLNGAQQVPPVQTGATGKADLTYDPATRVLTWDLNHSGSPAQPPWRISTGRQRKAKMPRR